MSHNRTYPGPRVSGAALGLKGLPVAQDVHAVPRTRQYHVHPILEPHETDVALSVPQHSVVKNFAKAATHHVSILRLECWNLCGTRYSNTYVVEASSPVVTHERQDDDRALFSLHKNLLMACADLPNMHCLLRTLQMKYVWTPAQAINAKQEQLYVLSLHVPRLSEFTCRSTSPKLRYALREARTAAPGSCR